MGHCCCWGAYFQSIYQMGGEGVSLAPKPLELCVRTVLCAALEKGQLSTSK